MSRVTACVMAAAFGVVVFAGCAAPPASEPAPVSHDLTPADLEAVRTVWNAIVEADSRADWHAVGDLLTDDVVHLDPRTGLISGKAAWRAWVDRMEFGTADLDLQVEEVGGSGDLAYVVWTSQGSWTEAGKPVTARGKGLTLFVRTDDGSWKEARNAWNMTPDEEEGS